MTLKETLNNRLKDAMRASDEDGKRIYRMALSSIKYVEKEQGKELNEEDTLQIIQKEIKIRRESLSEALKSGREEAAAEAQKDIEVLETLLPKQMSPEEVKDVVSAAIAEIGASVPADMGKVMKAVMPKLKGLADSSLISKTVKELLS